MDFLAFLVDELW